MDYYVRKKTGSWELLVWFGLAAYLNMLLLKRPFARMMAASEEQDPDQGDEDDFRDDNRLP